MLVTFGWFDIVWFCLVSLVIVFVFDACLAACLLLLFAWLCWVFRLGGIGNWCVWFDLFDCFTCDYYGAYVDLFDWYLILIVLICLLDGTLFSGGCCIVGVFR